MSNLINYVKKNKDKTFKEYPFNEIDAAIYTALSYIDFSGIITDKITIKEAYDKTQDRFLLKSKDKFKEQNRALFKEMANSVRFKDNVITSYKKLVNNNTQFGAITIVVPKHFKFIAFEGTEDELVGWEENFKMAYMYPVPAHEEAITYLKENIKPTDFVVYIGGHSKGGNLAMAAAMEANLFKRYQIDYVFNFDGPGFSKDLVDFKKQKKIEKKLLNYYPCESIVGMIFESLGKNKIIKSEAVKVYQHDIHSWLISDNKFIEGELSLYSQKVHQKIDALTKKYSKDEVKKFVNTFFFILYGAGYIYKSDLKKLSLEKMKNLLSETRSLNEDERKLLFNVFKTMVENTKEVNK